MPFILHACSKYVCVLVFVFLHAGGIKYKCYALNLCKCRDKMYVRVCYSFRLIASASRPTLMTMKMVTVQWQCGRFIHKAHTLQYIKRQYIKRRMRTVCRAVALRKNIYSEHRFLLNVCSNVQMHKMPMKFYVCILIVKTFAMLNNK